ncbi:CHASE2 domain-containing protein [Calditrichota bacterium]
MPSIRLRTVSKFRLHRSSVAGLVTVLALVLLNFSGVFQRWERNIWDIYTRFEAGKRKPDPRLMLAAVDQRGLDYFADNGVLWPWPRDVWGHLVETAEDGGALGVLLDVLYDDAGIDRLNSNALYDDLALADKLGKSFPTAIAAHLIPDEPYPEKLPEGLLWRGKQFPAYRFTDYGIRLPHDRFKHSQIGIINVIPDPDGIIRWIPLSFDVDGDTLAGLSMQIVKQIFPDNYRIPYVDDEGKFWIRYYDKGGPGGAFEYVSAAALITGMIPPDSLKGKIILVGGFASGLLDYKPAPVADPTHPFPGFEIHATVLSNILQGDELRHFPTTTASVWILLFGLLALPANQFRRRIQVQVIFYFIIGFVIVFAGWIAFRYNYLAPTISPLLACYSGIGMQLFVDWHLEGRQRARLHRLFSRYLHETVIDDMLASSDEVHLQGTEMKTTILFADMVGFSNASERLRPEEVVAMLNDYYRVFVDIILEHRGFLDKYIGDAVMVLFGAPVGDEQTTQLAADSILKLMEALEKLSNERIEKSLPTLAMRIGVHSDDVIVGNIGHPRRMDFTAIGNGVNIASRLEGANRHFMTKNLVSINFCSDLDNSFDKREIGRVILKGLTQPLKIFELIPEDKAGDWLVKWNEAWDSWFEGKRRKAHNTWYVLSKERPEDKALEFLLERLRPFINLSGDNDDVVVLDKK